jgi:DNA polymerase-3 subunit gamma/tau
MAYQVIARKWRPQRFDDVIGQRGVTQTLRNAISLDRLAQAFVFAGPRGVGKTTTARILARALNCVQGPTASPCGECDACREITEGRDIDVLEIDAATHTQVDNIREVIISGLSIVPVRDRYKVFIIDEIHQLSASSFNALLKSIEEPPPHVVFIMATTLIDKIPDTVLSRSQVFEFRTIGLVAIAQQLRVIVAAEGIDIDDAGLALIARAAEGSMRDAQSALDQVIAFAGTSVTVDEVATVLGVVGRDAVFDVAETIADETAPRIFDLAGRFLEAGYDLRSVCRELSRLVRDLLVIKVDSDRIFDPEIATAAERERMGVLATRFSREDLLRGFEVLSRAEFEIRSATQPRYHFEVAMLRWMHLRKLVPLSELIEGLDALPATPPTATTLAAAARAIQPAAPDRPTSSPTRRPVPLPVTPPAPLVATPAPRPAAAPSASGASADLKVAFLAEVERTKKFFHGTVAAQAQQVDVDDGSITFVFTTTQRTLAQQVETSRPWLEALATRIIGRKMTIGTRMVEGAALAQTPQPSLESAPEVHQSTLAGPPHPSEPPVDLDLSPVHPAGQPPPPTRPSSSMGVIDGPADDLLSQAMGDQAVQAMLEVLPAEIKDVEEL